MIGGVVDDVPSTWAMPANQAFKYLGISVFEYIILVRWPSYWANTTLLLQGEATKYTDRTGDMFSVETSNSLDCNWT